MKPILSSSLTKFSGSARAFLGRFKKRPDSVEHRKKGEVLSAPSPDSDFVYLLLRGSGETSRRNAAGRLEPAGRLVPGDSIGLWNPDSEGDGTTSPTTVNITSDSTLLRLSRKDLKELLRRNRRLPSSEPARVPVEVIGGRAPGVRRGTIACFAALGENVPLDAAGEAVAQVLQHETHASVIRVRIDGTESASSLAAWAKAPVSERGGVAMVDYQAAVSREELMQIAHMLTHLSSRFQYVLVEASPHASIDVVSECAAAAGSTYVLLRQNAENLFAFSLFSREIRTRLDSIEFLRPLVWLAAEENAHGLSQYIRETVGLPVHMYLRESDGNGLVGGCAPGWRRLAREICGRRVGLALASGAARGLSHIGVIQVLEENGIEVDAVAGSSMGAYVAAVWGKGYSGREMEKFARTLEGYKGMWRLMDTVFPPVRGFLHTDRVRKRLQRTIGSAHFSDMVRPIRVVATRIDTLERVVFHGGNVVDAVLASIAIPGVCVPVELDGVPYVDGGIVDPLPVSALEEMGIDKIIAVNTIATPASMRAYREIAEADRQGFLGAQLARWNALWNPFAYGNAFDTLLRSIHASQTRMAEASCSRANVVLRPYSCDGRWHDFGRPAHYIELGRKAAEEQLGEIKALFSLPPQ